MPNLIFRVRETSIVFADSPQSPDHNLSMGNLASGAGRISARRDWEGSPGTAISRLYEWRATFQFAVNPTIGTSVDIHMSTSDGTNPDGEEGTIDTDLSAEAKLRNMIYIGSMVVDVATFEIDQTASGFFNLNARYGSIVVFNNTDQALRNSTSVNRVIITPVPNEVQ